MTRKRESETPESSQMAARLDEIPGKAKSFTRRKTLLALLGAGIGIGAGGALFIGSAKTMANEVVVYKNPSCGCCSNWAKHLRAEGFAVEVKAVDNMPEVKEMFGTPWQLESCHTAIVDNYVIEGHVPVREIKRLLAERPVARGLAVPGMPAGSPGMEGRYSDPYKVMLFQTDGSAKVYASY